MFLTQFFEPTQSEVVTFVDPVDSSCWFHAGSMAEALDFTNPHRYISSVLDDHEYREVFQGKGRPALYVREEGVYILIMRSKSPFATAFQRWLAYEVLPTLRKTGAFGSNETKDSGGSSEFWQLMDGALARNLEPERVIALKHQYDNPGFTPLAKPLNPQAPAKNKVSFAQLDDVSQSIQQWTASLKPPFRHKVGALYESYRAFCQTQNYLPVSLREFSTEMIQALQQQHPKNKLERKRFKSGWHIIG